MEVLSPVCCGLDVHKASVTACLRSPGDGPPRRQEVHTFGTSTRAYHVLRDGVSYRELGGDYFDHLHAQRLTRFHTQRLAALVYRVTLTESAARGDPNPR